MDKGYFNLTLFLDLRKAFDTVDHKILLKKLYYYGIASNDLAWFESYLSNRIQYCSIDGHDSEPKTNPAVIPQSSFLGPILFLVYINDLTCTVEHSETNLFADDTNLTCTDKMLREAQQKINDDLVILGEWLAANKLSANLIKTEYMILATASKLNKMNFSPLIKLNGKPIKRVSTSDYLGLITDGKLSWQQYISSLKRKISSDLKNQLQRLQDRAARIITKGNDADNLLAQLGFLNVLQLIDFYMAIMVHKTLHNTAPSYFSGMFREVKTVHNHNTGGSQHGLFPTHHNLKTGPRNFSHYRCSVWNRIDRDVQEITNIEYLKKNLKKFLIKMGILLHFICFSMAP